MQNFLLCTYLVCSEWGIQTEGRIKSTIRLPNSLVSGCKDLLEVSSVLLVKVPFIFIIFSNLTWVTKTTLSLLKVVGEIQFGKMELLGILIVLFFVFFAIFAVFFFFSDGDMSLIFLDKFGKKLGNVSFELIKGMFSNLNLSWI